MVKTIHARGLLKIINWDFERMLDDSKVPCDKILATMKKRLERVKDTDYHKIDWR